MIAPGFAGLVVDHYYGTNYVGLLGFLIGLTVGIWQMLTGPQSILQRTRKH
jgi:hypothetical protein